ncbi:MAG: class I SAM-dependent methyltransferase [Blastocatellia bacterium]
MSLKSFFAGWFGKTHGHVAHKAAVESPVLPASGREAILSHYSRYRTEAFDYATARDYCDSADWLSPLMLFNGDLKDVQRPWMLKAVLATTPPGSRLIEIGGGEPRVAAALTELGYHVTLVDPYDGAGNGPTEYEHYVRRYPNVRLLKDRFSADLPFEPESCAAIFSISVLEHLPADEVANVFAGIRKFLRPGGYSIHCIDSVVEGRDADFHYRHLKLILGQQAKLTTPDQEPDAGIYDRLLAQLGDDLETFYLSAQGHHLWRGNASYKDVPFQKIVSIQTCSQQSQGN